jgi:hypothetical protein
MRAICRPYFLVAIAVALASCLAVSANGQSPWLNYNGRTVVNLRYASPSFDTDGYWQASGMVVNLDITGRLNEKSAMVVSVPYAHYSESHEDYYWGTESIKQDLVGNPYFGVQVRPSIPYLSYDFGVRLPLVSDNKFAAALTGMLSDVDQFEAFIPDYMPIHFGFTINLKNEQGLFTRVKIFPYSWIYVGDSKYVDDTEFALHYGAVSGFENQNIRVQGGISGFSLLTEDQLLFDDSSLKQFGMEMSYRLGKFWPGIHFRIPLDDEVNDVVNLVWGISVLYEGE